MPRGKPRAGHHRDYRGRYVDPYGYVRVHAPGHPMADTKGWVAEHRLVMANTLGRVLEPDEIVHHLNEDKTDNRPENLAVMSQSEHMREHPENMAAARAVCDFSAAGKLGATARWGRRTA